MKATDKAFYSGIITALNLIDLHGADTIYAELVATCDVTELVEAATSDGELEWSGLIKHGYAKKRAG